MVCDINLAIIYHSGLLSACKCELDDRQLIPNSIFRHSSAYLKRKFSQNIQNTEESQVWGKITAFLQGIFTV